MEFIKAEEFLRQPVEVQKVFINWWLDNFNFGNLCYNEKYEKCVTINKWQYNFSCISSSLEGECILSFEEVTPLFNEGQLRQFIEDKTDRKIDLSYYRDTGYDMCLDNFKGWGENRNIFHLDLGTNLLQAYWKVAIKITKEE